MRAHLTFRRSRCGAPASLGSGFGDPDRPPQSQVLMNLAQIMTYDANPEMRAYVSSDSPVF